jgi:hypothetical protein
MKSRAGEEAGEEAGVGEGEGISSPLMSFGLRTPSPHFSVHREKVLVHSGCKSHPGTGSLRPVAIEAVGEATKPLEPSV